jgi:uncharacterized protein YbjT (DUF2867 family)
MKILVTGAAGTVGSQVVLQLAEKGVQVRAAVHTPAKAAHLAHKNVELAPFDLTDAASVESAVKGVDKIYFLSPPIIQNQTELAFRLIDLAKKAGVKQVVRQSAMGCEMEPGIQLGRWLRAVEKHIESSGIAWTHLRPTFFMQNFITFPAMQGNYYLPYGEGKIGYIDVRDIAAVAVSALTGTGHEGKVYELTGPESLGVADVVKTISTASAKDFKYVDVPPEAARAGMIQHGLPEWYADALSELYAGAKAGYAAKVTDTVEKVLGRKPRTLQQFAQDHATKF